MSEVKRSVRHSKFDPDFDLFIKTYRTEAYKNSYSIFWPALWNKMPLKIRKAESFNIFKNRSFKYFLRNITEDSRSLATNA